MRRRSKSQVISNPYLAHFEISLNPLFSCLKLITIIYFAHFETNHNLVVGTLRQVAGIVLICTEQRWCMVAKSLTLYISGSWRSVKSQNMSCVCCMSCVNGFELNCNELLLVKML